MNNDRDLQVHLNSFVKRSVNIAMRMPGNDEWLLKTKLGYVLMYDE